ncbi:hypothetical protein CEXT_585211 [Caerostris extrusa]|uniref:Uncharacterized protein n=1 Tax=Caerostris extrusa TaxID=172846 RepID=A0AAV4QHR7_CAEEX|nr:hypothetical protein CEXT_585211 [Caerostris extrusa]
MFIHMRSFASILKQKSKISIKYQISLLTETSYYGTRKRAPQSRETPLFPFFFRITLWKKAEPCERRLKKKFRTRAAPRSVFCKYRWGVNEERPVSGPNAIDVSSAPTNPFKSNDQNFSTSEERVLDNENGRRSLRKEFSCFFLLFIPATWQAFE